MRIYPDLHTIYDKVVHIGKIEYNIKINPSDLEFTTFMQTFADTAGLLRENASDFAGQAFSDYPITIVHDTQNNIYFVFQDDTPAYGMKPSENNTGYKVFMEDIRKHTVKPKYIAFERYV